MAQILHEVEPIDNLDGLRCPLPNPLSVHWSDKTQLLDLFNGLHEPPFRVFPSHYSTTHLNLSSSRMAQTQEMLARFAKFTQAFDGLLKSSGVEPVVLPPRSPNLKAYCEQFVRSIREEVLHQMIIMAEESLRLVLTQYLAHYHAERNHQGPGNQLI